MWKWKLDVFLTWCLHPAGDPHPNAVRSQPNLLYLGHGQAPMAETHEEPPAQGSAAAEVSSLRRQGAACLPWRPLRIAPAQLCHTCMRGALPQHQSAVFARCAGPSQPAATTAVDINSLNEREKTNERVQGAEAAAAPLSGQGGEAGDKPLSKNQLKKLKKKEL